MSPLVRTDAQARQAKREGSWGSLNWLANEELTGSQKLTVGHVVIRKGMNNPRHSHPNCEEILYLLSGKLEHEVAGQWVTLQPGDTLVILPGAPHHARSVGDVDAQMIVAYDTGKRAFQLEK